MYLYKMQKNGNFNYHSKCERLKITNLCFADDLFMFARGDRVPVNMMMDAFNQFSRVTGLVVNPHKCQLYWPGVCVDTKSYLFHLTGFQKRQLPFKYLGVPVTDRKLVGISVLFLM